jgi:hypothetical protein
MNYSLNYSPISKKKVKVVCPRKWTLVVHLERGEITRFKDKPFPGNRELREIEDEIIEKARFFYTGNLVLKNE